MKINGIATMFNTTRRSKSMKMKIVAIEINLLPKTGGCSSILKSPNNYVVEKDHRSAPVSKVVKSAPNR